MLIVGNSLASIQMQSNVYMVVAVDYSTSVPMPIEFESMMARGGLTCYGTASTKLIASAPPAT